MNYVADQLEMNSPSQTKGLIAPSQQCSSPSHFVCVQPCPLCAAKPTRCSQACLCVQGCSSYTAPIQNTLKKPEYHKINAWTLFCLQEPAYTSFQPVLTSLVQNEAGCSCMKLYIASTIGISSTKQYLAKSSLNWIQMA